MADFTLKQHDTWPPMDAVLSDANGPINLTGAVVRLILKTVSGVSIVGGVCSITNAVGGGVRYEWETADTENVATYQGEFEITFVDGEVATVPNDGYFEVMVVADLG